MERNITPQMKLEFDKRIICRSPTGIQKNRTNLDILQFFQDDPIFREGIYLASRELYGEVMRHFNTDKVLSDKLKTTLIKYRNRMENRSTPFGLFAGVTVVSWDTHAVEEGNSLRRTVRLDSSCISQLINFINTRTSVIDRVKFLKNNSVYKVLNNLKYVNYSNKRAAYKNFTLITLKRNSGIEEILKYCERESKTISDIIDHLKQLDYETQEAIDFVRLLIEEGIIVSEFQIRLTNTADHLSDIIEFLGSIDNDLTLQNLAIHLDHIQKIICKIEKGAEAPDILIDMYEKIRDILSGLDFFEVPRNFIQVDVYKQCDHHEINNNNELINSVKLLNRLFYSTSPTFNGFKERFIKKYGNTPVLLNEVIDPEIGIGYPYGVVNKDFTSQIKRKLSQSFELNDAEQFLLKKILKSSSKETEIIISDEDLNNFPVREGSLPATTSILFCAKPVKDATHFLIKNIHSKSAINVLGRFSYVDKEIEDLVKSICAHEGQVHRDKVVAEVVHFPSMERLGNVMFRKHFRAYEIPYIASASTEANIIDLDDLYLWHIDGRIILYSNTLKKEVIPYHSCAHNYNYDSLSLYKLLCDLTDQGNRFHFGWGKLEQVVNYLPRVRYKNVILSPRTWFIEVTTTDITAFMRTLETENVPSTFLLSEGDNELLIDLKNDETVSVLKSFLKKGISFTIKENFFAENDPVNEYVATLYNKHFTASKHKTIKKNNSVKKIFNPGSEWVYYKLYVNINIANSILINQIQPVIKSLTKLGLIDSWFFIRYGDPDYHIRFRFRSKRPTDAILLLKNKLDNLISKGFINSVSIESYERELQRYGHYNIEDAEQLFFEQSNAVLKLISHNLSEIELYLIAIRSIMTTLDNFGFSVSDAKEFCSLNRERFKQEIVFTKKDKLFADTLYRTELKLAIKKYPDVLDKKIQQILKKLDLGEKKNTHKILANLQKDNIHHTTFCGSLIHMLVNRLFESNNRTHEFLLYYLLTKVYSDYKYLFDEKAISF